MLQGNPLGLLVPYTFTRGRARRKPYPTLGSLVLCVKNSKFFMMLLTHPYP